jgi:hypothetical protein
MEGSDRDSARDWLLTADATPPRLGELVERIDEALAIARASEKAVMTVGAAALDAAEQAHRSALLAEQASISMLEGRRPPMVDGAVAEHSSLRSFSERADRVVARLRALERIP